MIHLNLEHGSSNQDILESYYFARVLDNNLQKDNCDMINVEMAIRETEWHFENEFDEAALVQ